jgi:hypothetical protein
MQIIASKIIRMVTGMEKLIINLDGFIGRLWLSILPVLGVPSNGLPLPLANTLPLPQSNVVSMKIKSNFLGCC